MAPNHANECAVCGYRGPGLLERWSVHLARLFALCQQCYTDCRYEPPPDRLPGL